MSALPLTLFGYGEPRVASNFSIRRTILDPCCWIDHATGFLEGADQLLIDLETKMDWFRGKRLMYGQYHDEPRRTGTESKAGKTLPTVIETIRTALSTHYDQPFMGLHCNHYETGEDCVAWHADRIGRTEIDPLVAIVSLGGPRTFRMRPQSGGPSHGVRLESGDLLVMGGATQHHWEHAVPKTAHAAPRMSVTMRACRRSSTQRPRWQPQDELQGALR